MEKDKTVDKRRCPAMIEAGIIDPNSPEGMKFCLNCPYPNHCIVFDNDSNGKDDKGKLVRATTAKSMKDRGWSIEEIAKAMGKDVRTIKRYIKGW